MIRERRGLPDKLVDAELSEKRRQASLIRWQKARENPDPSAPRHGTAPRGGFMTGAEIRAGDRAWVKHVLDRLGRGRMTALELLADAQPELARIVLAIARDPTEPANSRLRAAELAWEWCNAGALVLKPAPALRSPETMSDEELSAAIADLRDLKERLGQELRASRAPRNDAEE
jgi:hypothetical protein